MHSEKRWILCELVTVILFVAHTGYGQEIALANVGRDAGSSGVRNLAPSFGKFDEREMQVRSRLDALIEPWNMDGGPFSELQNMIQETSGLRLVVDPDCDLTADTPISSRLENVSLRTALDIILKAHGCTFVVRDGLVIIGQTEYTVETRVIPLSEAVANATPPTELVELLKKSTGLQNWGDQSSLCVVGKALIARNGEPVLFELQRLLTALDAPR